ncbi:MAG: hypothetical protein QOF06_567 [Solirubrobacterales bacterium]|jgi:hypothetical protein|nr:hypothetical protein [Solirubrobacterales bacterium]
MTGVVVADWSSATPVKPAPFRRHRDRADADHLRIFRASVARTLALALLLAAIAGCGAEDGSAAGRSSAGPVAFPDESWAELASDEDDLWLAVAGYTRGGEFRLRVFEKAGLRARVSGDLPLSIAASPASPEGRPASDARSVRGHRPSSPVSRKRDGGDWTCRRCGEDT